MEINAEFLAELKKWLQEEAGRGWNVGTFQRKMEFLCAALGHTPMDASETAISSLLSKVYDKLQRGEAVIPPLVRGKCGWCGQIIYLEKDHVFFCGD
jgi:hypothetical protein